MQLGCQGASEHRAKFKICRGTDDARQNLLSTVKGFEVYEIPKMGKKITGERMEMES